MPDRDNQDGGRRGPFIAFGAVVFLFLVGWLLARELYSDSKMEDCLMSGRSNCAPIEAPSR